MFIQHPTTLKLWPYLLCSIGLHLLIGWSLIGTPGWKSGEGRRHALPAKLVPLSLTLAAKPVLDSRKILRENIPAARSIEKATVPDLAKPHLIERTQETLLVESNLIAGEIGLFDYYHEAADISDPPIISEGVALDEEISKKNRNGGTMILVLWLNERGGIDKAEVEKSELPAAMTEGTVSAFKSASILPGKHQGFPVKSIYRLEITVAPAETPPAEASGIKSRQGK